MIEERDESYFHAMKHNRSGHACLPAAFYCYMPCHAMPCHAFCFLCHYDAAMPKSKEACAQPWRSARSARLLFAGFSLFIFYFSVLFRLFFFFSSSLLFFIASSRETVSSFSFTGFLPASSSPPSLLHLGSRHH